LQDGKDSSAGKLRKDAVIYFWHHETADFRETNFEQSVSQARLLYSAFVERGIHDGRKPELGGGGLIWRLGYDFNRLVSRVTVLLNLEPDKVTRLGRYPETIKARSVLCYWTARELGKSTLGLSKPLGISQPTASPSVKRDGRLVVELKFNLIG
jgi:hypothetical protein